MQSLALVIHVVLAVGVIGLVLIQHGKGADAGAAFGSGASATVFGARGSASFLTRATTALATLFFLTSIFLFYLAANREGSVRSVTDIPGLVDDAPAVSSDLPVDLPGGVVDETSESDLPPAPADETSSVTQGGDASAPEDAAGDGSAADGAVDGAAVTDLPKPAQ